MEHLLALDQGTTSSRAILFDTSGRPLATAQREFAQHFPRPGEVEHDAEEILATQLGCMSEVLARAGVSAESVAAVGITNQRETVVLFERATGRALARAIVWQDRRTAARCAELTAAGHAEAIAQRTGLVLDPYFSATKIAWLLDHVPGARARAERGELAIGTMDTWLIHRLTGGAVHATDPSNASRTLLFDIRRLDWDPWLCELFRVPPSVLPDVRSSAGDFGTIAGGLPLAGKRILGVAGDQQAALYGQGCDRPGLAKCTYGTGCFLLANTGTVAVSSSHRLLTTVAWQTPSTTHYALEGSVFIGGAVVQWLRDGLHLVRDAAQVEALARSVESSDGVTLVPAFAGLGAPHWDASARGVLCGITRGTSAGHVARAALESIALQVADLVECMDRDRGEPIAELRVDGGAARNDLLMQLQADLLGRPVRRPAMTESTALGAARLAGEAAGVWRGQTTLVGADDRLFLPTMEDAQREESRARWQRAVERARGWVVE
ncbi:MAG: glycerol kinase GlpK [Planctomycetota bacterium]